MSCRDLHEDMNTETTMFLLFKWVYLEKVLTDPYNIKIPTIFKSSAVANCSQSCQYDKMVYCLAILPNPWTPSELIELEVDEFSDNEIPLSEHEPCSGPRPVKQRTTFENSSA